MPNIALYVFQLYDIRAAMSRPCLHYFNLFCKCVLTAGSFVRIIRQCWAMMLELWIIWIYGLLVRCT